MPRVLALALLAACTSPESAVGTPVPLHPPQSADGEPVAAASPVLGLERLDGDGPFLADTIERFAVLLESDDVFAEVTTDAGTAELRDGEIVWHLPDLEGVAHLTLTVDDGHHTWTHDLDLQLIAVAAGAAGRIDPSDEGQGPHCDLAIGASDVPHVVYRDSWHEQLWYARFTGGQWVLELVDGPGFGVGTAVGVGRPSIALTASGEVRVAYYGRNPDGTDQVRYAARSAAGAWTTEVAQATDVRGSYPLQLSLDPANADRPTIFYTHRPINQERTAAVTRLGSAWTTSVYTAGTNNYAPFRGAVRTGAAQWLVLHDDDDLDVIPYAIAGGWGAPFPMPGATEDNAYTFVPTVSAGGAVGVYTTQGLHWASSTSAPFGFSYVADTPNASLGLAWDGAQPRLGILHGTNLELVRPDARGLWTFAVADTGVTNGQYGFALDSSGNAHACYIKNGAYTFY
jgi:hypothetical protein